MRELSKNLLRHMYGNWIITCTKCTDVHNQDAENEEEASRDFAQSGWGIVDGEAVCPECKSDA